MGAPEEAPKGIRPIWIQMKNYAKYGLSKQPLEEGQQVDMNDCTPYVLLDRAEILADIEKYGFMVDFNDYKTDLQKFKAEQILMVWDREKRYGEDWYFCYTQEAFEEQMGLLLEAEATALEAVLQEENEEEEKEEDLPVFEDVPMQPRPWESATADESSREVDDLTVVPSRERVRVVVTRPWKSIGLPCKLADRDAMEWLTDESIYKIGIKKYQDVAFNAYDPDNPDKKLMESGSQAAPLCVPGSSQTAWRRPQNASVQCDPPRMLSAEKREVLSSEGMRKFLSRAAPLIEEALESNETIDMFTDSFNLIGLERDDDSLPLGKQNDNDLKELRTFMDLDHSKNRTIAAIDWLPREKGLVAVSPVRHVTFEQWVQASGHVAASHILIWDFQDLITPMLKLASSHAVHCFRFNRSDHRVVVGGTSSGQVVAWDTSDAISLVRRRKKAQSTRHLSGNVPDESDTKPLPSIQPLALSHIDSSHRRSVADIAWLPPSIQINSRGKFLAEEHLDNTSYQFVTIAGDGLCLFWDLRYKEIADGQLPHIARPRAMDKKREDGRGGAAGPSHVPWTPLFRMQLNCLEGVGELSLCRLVEALGNTEVPDLASQIICATEEGEIVMADWQARGHAAAAEEGGGTTGEEEGGEPTAPDFVKWVAKDQTRPCVALQKSPFFPDMVLSVADWSFQIWRTDQQNQIFSSPMAAAYITCGRWSPTRPGTIFLGKVDGSIDVWDLADNSYSPCATLLACPSAITSLEFPDQEKPDALIKGKSPQQQLLAVGDAVGNLHIFDVPHTLWRPSANEKSIVRAFFTREQMYFTERIAARPEMEDDDEVAEDGQAPAADNASAKIPIPVAEGGEQQQQPDVPEIDPAIVEAEKQYRAFEESFKAAGLDLGIAELQAPIST